MHEATGKVAFLHIRVQLAAGPLADRTQEIGEMRLAASRSLESAELVAIAVPAVTCPSPTISKVPVLPRNITLDRPPYRGAEGLTRASMSNVLPPKSNQATWVSGVCMSPACTERPPQLRT